VIDSSPTAEKSQPMALPGRCPVITAPTTMNAVKARYRARLTPVSRWKLPLSTDRETDTAKQTTKIASMDQATRVERLRTVMPRLLWSPSTYSTEVSTVATLQLTAVHSMGIPSRHRYELRHNDERRLCDKPVKKQDLSDGPLVSCA
jgi:hypothetical protein